MRSCALDQIPYKSYNFQVLWQSKFISLYHKPKVFEYSLEIYTNYKWDLYPLPKDIKKKDLLEVNVPFWKKNGIH